VSEQPYPQTEDQCLEVHQTYCDNEFGLSDLNVNSTKIGCDDYNQQMQPKIKRVTIIKPIINTYPLSTLSEENEELL